MKAQQTRANPLAPLIKPTAIVLLVGIIFVAMLAAITLGGTLGGGSATEKIRSFLGLDTTQIWWYVTRAAGLTGYILLWLSMVWGLAIPSKIIQPVLDGTFTYDFHEYLSLLGLGFVLLHIVVLLLDQYLPFTLVQLLIPFTDSYRPFWVGIGILSFYLLLVVTFTFYIRQVIGTQAFRAIHLFSLIAYLGATLHGLFAGTDSALPVTMVLYAGTFLVVLFMTVYWLVMRRVGKEDDEPSYAAPPARGRGGYSRR